MYERSIGRQLDGDGGTIRNVAVLIVVVVIANCEPQSDRKSYSNRNPSNRTNIHPSFYAFYEKIQAQHHPDPSIRHPNQGRPEVGVRLTVQLV